MSNTFGRIFRLTSFGESHGESLGGVIDGVPAGLEIDEAYVQSELDQRRPGQVGQSAVTKRREPDTVEFLSGIFNGVSTGCPIGFIIRNTNQKSGDYNSLKDIFRPGHADYTYAQKYGVRDYRGGGRSSGRETVSRVVGGAVASLLLREYGINIMAYTQELGGIKSDLPKDFSPFTELCSSPLPFFAPNLSIAETWEKRVKEVKGDCDSLGGVVRLMAQGLPAGLGEPAFDKLDARIAYALFGVGTVKGVEIGSGFSAPALLGSENNDSLSQKIGGDKNEVTFLSNNAGGVLGGISSGQVLDIRVALKPIASIAKEQHTVTVDGEEAKINIGGRHDISVIPRVVPVLKSMLALTLADFMLLSRTNKL